ncbi:TonB-dependent siderophore receptor [Roseimicrobium sp. ORNL1]|uniref:TonB-dependent siderophore receptor n=1 Tax=Roseimicrobium sp. ORNL1 TaxID=2711231 RepID=UPI0013E1AA9E|nr:TonB-dependent siderophore receptor [Roseimicrobium sp. ORNL1]QIF00307.1 TonB-dependent siderophore receptor [Roseimicrobium sp. ORNL1]
MTLRRRSCAAASLLVLGTTAAFSQTTAPAPAPAPTGGGVTLAPVTVTADAVTPYSAPVSNTGGLKMDVPLLQTPQAISVISEAAIKDQGVPKLEKILRNVAGVTPGGYYQDWDYYRLRGFDASFETYRDGLKGDYGLNSELYGVERVEVVKGPASTLYGQGPLGGLINLVSKKPSRDRGFSGEVGVAGGMWDHYEGFFDVNIPLVTPVAPVQASGKGAKNVVVGSPGSDTGVYARLVGLYRNQGSFVDYADAERVYVAPSLTWDISPDTSITFLADYTHDNNIVGMPLPASGTVRSNPNGNIDISRFIGYPGHSNEIEQSIYRIGYQFRHNFNDAVTLRQNLAYTYIDQKWNSIMYPSSLSGDGRTLYVYPYIYDDQNNRFAVDTALDIKFETGPIEHTLMVGVDYFREAYENSATQINYDDFPGSYVAIDLFRPSYHNLVKPSFKSYDEDDTDSLGFYFQDHAKLTDQLTLTFGGRYDLHWAVDDRQEAFTPKVGVTYEFVPGVAAYANYSRSFQPQSFSTDSSGRPVDPEEGENWEAGVKYNLAEGRITGMISVFQLTRENVATSNLSTPDPFDSTVAGEQRSRGVEFEIGAELAPGLDFIAAYTYLDTEVTEDNDIPVGTRLQGVPEHAASAWLKYTVQDGPLKGFGVGVGGTYVGDKAGDVNDTFTIPSYALLDAALFYERENYRIQVNFNNITDKRHFTGSYDDLYVLPGEPFNVSASVTWKF